MILLSSVSGFLKPVAASWLGRIPIVDDVMPINVRSLSDMELSIRVNATLRFDLISSGTVCNPFPGYYQIEFCQGPQYRMLVYGDPTFSLVAGLSIEQSVLSIHPQGSLVQNWSVAITRTRFSSNSEFIVRPSLSDFRNSCAPNSLLSIAFQENIQGSIRINESERPTQIRFGSLPHEGIVSVPRRFILNIATILGTVPTILSHSTSGFFECDPNTLSSLPSIWLSFGDLAGSVVIFPDDYLLYDIESGCSMRIGQTDNENLIKVNPLKIPGVNVMSSREGFIHLCDTIF